jgi:hypothetical protein
VLDAPAPAWFRPQPVKNTAAASATGNPVKMTFNFRVFTMFTFNSFVISVSSRPRR